MKVKKIDSGFKPIKLEVFIESEEELYALEQANYSLLASTLRNDVSDTSADILEVLLKGMYGATKSS